MARQDISASAQKVIARRATIIAHAAPVALSFSTLDCLRSHEHLPADKVAAFVKIAVASGRCLIGDPAIGDHAARCCRLVVREDDMLVGQTPFATRRAIKVRS